jgi:hypothetical protein
VTSHPEMDDVVLREATALAQALTKALLAPRAPQAALSAHAKTVRSGGVTTRLGVAVAVGEASVLALEAALQRLADRPPPGFRVGTIEEQGSSGGRAD